VNADYYMEYDNKEDVWEVFDGDDYWVASFDDVKDAEEYIEWKEMEDVEPF
jgi:hypothetical protein